MEPQTIKFVGAPCGRHGPYTFYKAFKYKDPNKEGRLRVLSLGEFFFAKISQEAPLCCAELQLLWEDKNNESILLSSVRLYFLPEHTPDGRKVFHGEDEVLADGEKVVLKIDDLLQWIVHPDDASWSSGTRAVPFKMDVGDGDQADHDKMVQMFAANNSGLQLDDIRKEKKLCDNGERIKCQIIILSYSQYCRYRGIRKRVETVEDEWLKSAIVCAIGGFTLPQNCDTTYVLFCKDTFEHPELQDHKFRKDYLAPNLKGRPRKKKLNFHKLNGGDSSDSEASILEKSFSRDTISKEVKKRHSTRTRGDDLSREEQAFFEALYKFMKDRRTPIERIPSLGFKQLDLYAFYTMSQKLGGYDKVCEKKLWKALYDKLGGNPGNTSAATCTRRHYERLLLSFEKSKKGQEFKFSLRDKKKGRFTDGKKDGELRRGKAENKPESVSRKTKNSILADRAKQLQVLREQSLQKQQQSQKAVRKTVKHELELRNQQKENASSELVGVKNELAHVAKPANHIIDKERNIPVKSLDMKERQVVNGAAIGSHIPPPGLVLPDKIPRNKMMGPDMGSTARGFPAQSMPVKMPTALPPSQHNRPQHVPATVPPHFLQQHLSRSFHHQHNNKPAAVAVVPRDSKPSDVPGPSGRPSVIQHTARSAPPMSYGPPGLFFGSDFDGRKRPFPFGDASGSLVNDSRQPFPTPPPAHTNSHRTGSMHPDLRTFSAPVDSIKRLRMDDNRSYRSAAAATATTSGPTAAKAEPKGEVIDLECNESLEPMDFSLKGDTKSDVIKTVVKSEDEPLCLVTHKRKDSERSDRSSATNLVAHRRTQQQQPPPHATWQTTHKGASTSASHSHGARPLNSSVNHSASKHDITSSSNSLEHIHSRLALAHAHAQAQAQAHASSVAGGAPNNKLPSTPPNFLLNPPAHSISAGLPAHIAAAVSQPSSSSRGGSSLNSSSSSSGSSSSHRQQPAQHPTSRPSASAPAKPEPPKLDAALHESLLHPAFFPMGAAARLLPPGMLPLQMPSLLYPSLLSPTGLPGMGMGLGLGGKDGISAAAAAAQAQATAAALQSGAQVPPNYLISVPAAQAYQNLYLNRPPK